MSKKKTFLGQDPAILLALWANVVSWLVRSFAPGLLPRLLPTCEQEDTSAAAAAILVPSSSSSSTDASVAAVRRRSTPTRCVAIGRPGGVEQLRLIALKPGVATCGYNVLRGGPFTDPIVRDGDVPDDCVVLDNDAFSVNYADCCIRWGLYESAKQFVGYPIVPGFDVAGTVARVGTEVKQFKVGDKVFGCSLFGAYSSRALVPALQLRKIPAGLTAAEAASLPAVALTALYALFLAGHYPTPSRFNNKAILIHSAAGGVGSMLVQMAKVLGLGPVVGVVGRTSKVDAARALGCDVVIDKSREPDLWKAAEAAAPHGYAAIMDSNGVSTLQQSYDHLAKTGRLVVFGFHTNLPMGRDALSPLEWLRMARKMKNMPKFDPMEMGAENKAVLAFNLSFFADEREMLSDLFDQVVEWLKQGRIKPPRVVEMPMNQVADAHGLIQSGTSIGKIILNTH